MLRTMLTAVLAGGLILGWSVGGWVAADVRKEDVPRLLKELKSTIPKVRASAAVDLGDRGAIKASDVKEAIPILIDLVKKDRDVGVRKAAALALGKCDPDPSVVVPVLMEALKDKSTDVQVAAAQALGLMGPGAKKAVPALRAMQKNKEKKALSRAAGMALKSINAK